MSRSLWSKVGLGAAALTLAGGLFMTSPVRAEDGRSLQERVEALTPQQQAALLLLLDSFEQGGAAAPAAGEEAAAAAPAGGPTDPAVAMKEHMATLLEAAKKGDVDAVMGLVSEDFDYYQVGGKEELRDFIANAIDMGYVEMYAEDVEISLDDAEIERDGDTVTIYPVVVSGPFGAATLEFEAKWENDAWRITTLEIEGV